MEDFVIKRLVNFNNTGGGTNLPPRQFGSLRVPIVTGLKILKVDNFFGGTTYTLGWNSPDFKNIDIAQFNVFISGIDGVAEPQGPYTAFNSPAVIRVTTKTVSRLIFTVQTQLTNGMTSPLETSPSVAAESILPSTNTGTLDHLQLPVVIKTSGPYTITSTDYLVIGDTTSGSFSVLLPASPNIGDVYSVKKSVAANTLTFSGNGKNIDGAASIAIATQYTSYTVIYNGTEWSII